MKQILPLFRWALATAVLLTSANAFADQSPPLKMELPHITAKDTIVGADDGKFASIIPYYYTDTKSNNILITVVHGQAGISALPAKIYNAAADHSNRLVRKLGPLRGSVTQVKSYNSRAGSDLGTMFIVEAANSKTNFLAITASHIDNISPGQNGSDLRIKSATGDLSNYQDEGMALTNAPLLSAGPSSAVGSDCTAVPYPAGAKGRADKVTAEFRIAGTLPPAVGTGVIVYGFPNYDTTNIDVLVGVSGVISGYENGAMVIRPDPGQFPAYRGMSGGPIVLESDPSRVVGNFVRDSYFTTDHNGQSLDVLGTNLPIYGTPIVIDKRSPAGVGAGAP